jgi:hypothetical protein
MFKKISFYKEHKKVSDYLKSKGFEYMKDFSFSGTLGDSTIGKKPKNYLTFNSESCYLEYILKFT